MGSKKRLITSCRCRDSNLDLSQQPGSTRLSRRLNPSAEAEVLNPYTKQDYITNSLFLMWYDYLWCFQKEGGIFHQSLCCANILLFHEREEELIIKLDDPSVSFYLDSLHISDELNVSRLINLVFFISTQFKQENLKQLLAYRNFILASLYSETD